MACGSAAPPVHNHGNMGFYSSADAIIEKLEKIEKDASSYFMLALAYKEQKQTKKALLSFANSCFVSHRNEKLTLYPIPVFRFVTSFNTKSEYYYDALYEIALIMYSYKEYEYTQKFLDKISNDNRGLYFEARLLLSRAQQAQEQYSKAEKTLSNELDKTRNESMTGKLLIRRASLYEGMDEFKKAADDYNKILEKKVSSWQSEIAASQMYQLVSNGSIQANTTALENLARGLHLAKKYKEALEVLNMLQKNPSAKKEILAEYYVRTLTRLNRSKDASGVIENAYKQKLVGQNIMADELWRAGNRDSAIALYQEMLKSLSKSEKELALYRIASHLSDKNRKGHVSFLEQYVNSFPKAENAAQLTWLYARALIENGQLKDAEKILKQYLEYFPNGRYSDQCRFWLHKFYSENTNKDLASRYAYQLTKVNPDSPYTLLLLERESNKLKVEDIRLLYKNAMDNGNADESLYYHSMLFAKEKDKQERNKRISDLSSSLTKERKRVDNALKSAFSGSFSDKQFRYLENYMATAYFDGIERITSTLEDDESIEIEKAAVLAYLGKKYDYAFYSVYYGQQLLKNLSVKENIFILSDEFNGLVFPRPFGKEVQQNAVKYKLNADMIYSLMKAESLFKHTAKSSAGAVGLMQLMPGTAKEIARNANIKKYDLTNPADSISFGSNYLGWLNTYYKSNFIYMVAGYNAGAGNVNKWIKKMPDKDEDYFTEFVAFRETRYYILRTGKFLRQYAILNGS